MKKIRNCIWETNSSTSHAFIILSEEDSLRWEKDSNMYAVKDVWNYGDYKIEKTKLYSRDEVLQYIKSIHNLTDEEFDDIDEIIRDEGFVSFSDWEDIELESDEETFVTPSGDVMVALFKYGYDY